MPERHGHEEHDHSHPDDRDDHHDHHEHHARMVADFRRRFWISAALTVPVLVLSSTIQAWLGLEQALRFPGDAYLQWAIATVIFLHGGRPFLAGLYEELSAREPGMMTLVGLAVTVAYGYSAAVVFGLAGQVFFWELATLVDVMLLGHWIEMKSVMGASSALQELVELMPAQAHRLDADGDTEDVPVDELRRGDRVLVKPGEKVPVDGKITKGRTSLDEAAVTGESRPVERGEGDDVIGGSVNSDGSITIEVEKAGRDTYLSQVVELVRRAQQSRSRTQDLTDRAAMWLTITAITVGMFTLAAWLVAGRDVAFSLERSVTVMVITCPHALGLAVPLVVAVSTAVAASHALLIRDRSAFERARKVDVVIFDKTGTLTEGRFGVTDVVAAGAVDEDDLLRLAAAVETESEHPIARGITAEAAGRGLEPPRPDDFSSIPGKGARARIDGKAVEVVSSSYLEDEGISPRTADDADSRLRELEDRGETIVHVLVDGEHAGAIALSDVIRQESRAALDRLKKMGVDVMMVTGDSEAVARRVAGELDLDEFFAEVLPDQKADRVQDIRDQGKIVAMVGDGVNDAPALATADIGIAIGAGTDVAAEAADIVLVRSDPRDVVAVVQLARATYRKIAQNLIWATGYNVVAIPLAAGVLYSAGVLLSPAVGAALMAVSTVVVAINARLLGVERGDRDSTRSAREQPA